MTHCVTEPTAFLLLPRLRVQNANAISGPLSWGFPSPTAFTGFAHALERKFSGRLKKGFAGVGIVCHRFEPQVHRPAGRLTQVFSLTRNPIHAGWKPFEEKPAALIEESRAHLEVSLVIAVKDLLSAKDGAYFAEDLLKAVHGMRLAGGSLLPARGGERFDAQWWPAAEDLEGQAQVFRKLRRRLLPGFALVQREDLLRARLEELRNPPGATALDALLDLAGFNIDPVAIDPARPAAVEWRKRLRPGWLVPLPIGYAGIAELHAAGAVENARDGATPFRFVESLYSLGEWVGPHQLENLQQLLWYTEADTDNGIYRCINRYSATSVPPSAVASHRE